MEVHINRVEADQEVTEDILLRLGHIGEKSADDVLSGGELTSQPEFRVAAYLSSDSKEQL